MAIKYIDAQGNFVAETDEKAAFTVNMNDPNALSFIEGVKRGKGKVDGAVDIKPTAEGRPAKRPRGRNAPNVKGQNFKSLPVVREDA